LELPVDVLAAAPAEEADIKIPVTRVTSRAVDREKALELAEMIRHAHKPIILLGSGAWYSDAGAELAELADKIGIPIFSQTNGRGVVPDDHPFCFGGISGIRPGAGLYASFSTDLAILLGTRLNLFTLFGDTFNPEAKMVQVDIEPEEIGRNRQIDLPVLSDIKAFVNELTQIIDQNKNAQALKAQFSDWISELHSEDKKSKDTAQEQWDSDAVPIHPMRMAKEVNAFMDQEDDIIVTDGGDTTIWLNITRTFRQAGHYLDYGIFGCLGGGIPYANTAKYLFPDKRVLLMSGDGSMGFNFMEFERAISKQIPIVVIISNDQGWGMIRHSQEVRLGHAINAVTELGILQYQKYVEAMGGVGFLVEKPNDIRPALNEAFKSRKVACINVLTDPTTVSPGSIALANVGAYKL
jgi:acetolactate synthase-1/2/3 large subunit